jgi:hypothetical protein
VFPVGYELNSYINLRNSVFKWLNSPLLLRSICRFPLSEATFPFIGHLPVMDTLFQVSNMNEIRPSVRALARPHASIYSVSVND